MRLILHANKEICCSFKSSAGGTFGYSYREDRRCISQVVPLRSCKKRHFKLLAEIQKKIENFVCLFLLLVQVFVLLLRLWISRRNLYQHIKHENQKKDNTNSSKKSKKISRYKQPDTLPDGAVGALQFCSSELSPQSSAPSQIQSLLTHTPLAQVIWNDLHEHFSSSELSKQSNEPSHRHAFLMQLPSLHWNWLGKQGVAVVIVGTGVEGSVFAFVVTGSGVRWWLFDNAIKRRNLFKCNAIQCSTRTMVLNLSKLPYAVGEESAKFGNIDRQMNNRVGF